MSNTTSEFGKVTAERLRLLAEKLRLETADPTAEITGFTQRLNNALPGQSWVSLPLEEAWGLVEAFRRTERQADTRGAGWRRELRETVKLEAVVKQLQAKLAGCDELDLTAELVRGDNEGDAITVDIAAELAFELQSLQEGHP